MVALRSVRLRGFRCFEDATVHLEPDLTVLFAENGGGKTSLLTAIAMGLAPLIRGAPKEAMLNAERDIRKVAARAGREPVAACGLEWEADLGGEAPTRWTSSITPRQARPTHEHLHVGQRVDALLKQGERWPLFAWYGVDRLGRGRRAKGARPNKDRWDGYAGCLDPRLSDGALLDWVHTEALADFQRHRIGEPERGLERAVFAAMECALPGAARVWFDPVEDSPMVQVGGAPFVPWSELSDGYHSYLALVGDIARRAATLNEMDGTEASLRVEGIVLIDEVDLHLHPRWQRVALDGLQRAFPKLQFIVSTHSPQVLSSARNRQVRRLTHGTIDPRPVLVEGRDSNAILRDLMGTSERDERGDTILRSFYDALDDGSIAEVRGRLEELRALWGDLDPEIVRAVDLLKEEEALRAESIDDREA